MSSLWDRDDFKNDYSELPRDKKALDILGKIEMNVNYSQDNLLKIQKKVERKKLLGPAPISQKIKVAVRIRPYLERDIGQETVVFPMESHMVGRKEVVDEEATTITLTDMTHHVTSKYDMVFT